MLIILICILESFVLLSERLPSIGRLIRTSNIADTPWMENPELPPEIEHNAALADRDFKQHGSMRSLVLNVAGNLIKVDSLLATTWYQEGVSVPNNTYLVDFAVTDNEQWNRTGLLTLAYVLMREANYNYTDRIISLSLVIRAAETGPDANCFFAISLGIGAASRLVPKQTPLDFESWFQTIKSQSNYNGAAENELELVYVGDPADLPICQLENWKINQMDTQQSSAGSEAFSSEAFCRQEARSFFEESQSYLAKFTAMKQVADIPTSETLSLTILDMQTTWQEFHNLLVPGCIESSASLIDAGMRSIIEGLLTFNQDPVYSLATNALFKEGNEKILTGVEQLRAIIDGLPTPIYDPIEAWEENADEPDGIP